MMSLLIATWGFGMFWAFTLTNFSDVLFWARFLNIVAIPITPFFIHFVFSFLNKKEGFKTLIIPAYVISFLYLIVALIWPEYFVKSLSQRPHFLYYPDAGPTYYFFPGLFFVGTLYGIFNLFTYYKKWTDPKRKRHLAFITFSMIVGLLGGGTTFFYVFNIPIYPFGAMGLTVLVATFFYAIAKHELMDISLTIKASTAYLITAGISLTSFGLVMIFAQENQLFLFFAILATGLVWTFFGQVIQTKLITTAKHKFIKGWYDYEKIVQQFTESFIPVYDRKAIFQTLKEGFSKIEIDEIYIVDNQTLEKPEYTNIQAQFNSQVLPISEKEIPKAWIIQLQKLTNFSIKIAIPIRSSETLEAVVFLGEKRGGISYKPQDLSLFQTLQNQLTIILDRIRPYEKIQKDLESTMAYAEQLNRQATMGKLTSQIAHEIRNPALMVEKAVEAAFTKGHNPEVFKQCDEIVRRNTRRMIEIIDIMLHKGGPGQKNPRACDLKQEIHYLFDIAGPMLKEKSIKVIPNYEDPLPEIWADPTAIFQILMNVFTNAIEALPPQGEIRLTAAPASYTLQEKTIEGVRLTIADNGPGMTEEEVAKLFTQTYSTKDPSRGMGLSIIRKLILDLGGDIQVSSAQGKGTEFQLMFPKAR